MTIVVFGEVRSGKTTLLSHMALHFHSISHEEEAEAARGELLVWLGDTTDEERRRYTTGRNKFRSIKTPRGVLYTIDTPSHPDHTADLTAALAMADCAILLLDGRPAEGDPYMFCSDESKRLIKIAGAMGVNQLICAVNYMTHIIEQEEAMDRMRSVIGNVCSNNGFDDGGVVWIPISGQYGFSIFPESCGFEFFQGYEKATPSGFVKGRTLMGAIEHTVLDEEDKTRHPRVHVLKTWRKTEGGITALGRIASGHIISGTEVVIPPYYQGTAKVGDITDVTTNETSCERGEAHGIYEFTFDDESVDVRAGSIIAEAGEGAPASVESFDAKFAMTSREVDFIDGSTFDVYIHAACVSCRIEVLSAARRKDPAKENPGSMRFRERGTVRFTPLEPLVVEAEHQQKPKSMYRFMVGKANEVVGAGIVKACDYGTQDESESWVVV